MKKFAFIHVTFLILFGISPLPFQGESRPLYDVGRIKAAGSIGCAPDRTTLTLMLAEADIPLMPGSGVYHWKISTQSDSAQLYFNQGINMYYGFHIIESLASFRKAALFDPENPMVWWAQALALGPNINDVAYSQSPEAVAFARKAVELSEHASPVEKSLIHAITMRYGADTAQTRQELDQAYVDAMANAYAQFPASADVATLYADAMMLQHPWELWFPNGTPKPWTPLIEKVLDHALRIEPRHPGANHYYIHTIEASPQPGKAMKSADILGSLAPGLAHVVHMPSHIYLRTGRFEKGTQVNERAVKTFRQYGDIFPVVNDNSFLYLLHNLHLLVNCGMQWGRYEYTNGYARELENSIDSSMISLPPPFGTYMQYMRMTPTLINVRFEKWDSLLMMPKPPVQYLNSNLLYHFGRGMAFAGKNEVPQAIAESAALKRLLADEVLTTPMPPFSPAIEGATCASEILEGFIAMQQNRMAEAIAHFSTAAEVEEKMVYNEPRDWMLNPKQYLGSAYVKAGRHAEGEKLLRRDLTVNDDNIWALNRLITALEKQGKKKDAEEIKKRLKKVGKGSDTDLSKLLF